MTQRLRWFLALFIAMTALAFIIAGLLTYRNLQTRRASNGPVLIVKIAKQPAKLTGSRIADTPPVSGNADVFKAVRFKTHAVVKGDTLWQLARSYELRDWQALHADNPDIADPHRIYPGQILVIRVAGTPKNPFEFVRSSELSARVRSMSSVGFCAVCHADGFGPAAEPSAKVSRPVKKSGSLSAAGEVRRIDGVFRYSREMGYPFGFVRDPVKAIEIAPVDNAILVEELLAAFGEESRPYRVRPGQRIYLLLFGDYRWVKNAQWVGDHEIEAEAWPSFVFGDRLITLVRGLGCYNLMIISEPVPLPPPPQFSEPPAITLPPPPQFSEPPALTLPPPPQFSEPPALTLPPPPTFKDFTRPDDVDLSIGMFAEDYYPKHDGNKVAGYWYMATWYPLVIMDSRGNSHSFGVAGGGNAWSGETGDDYRYHGLRRELDGAYRRRFFSSPKAQDELIVRIGVGQLIDEGSISPPGSGGKFESKQTTDLLVGYLAYEHNRDPKYKLWPKVRYSLFVDLDIGGKREDTWTDRLGTRAVNNPRPDKSMYVAAVDAQIVSLDNNQNVVLAAGLKGIKYAENERLGARVEAGVDFLKKAVEFRLNHTWWQYDNNQGPGKLSTESVGLGVTVNPSKFPLGMKKFLRNLFGKSSAEKNAKEVKEGYLPAPPAFPY